MSTMIQPVMKKYNECIPTRVLFGVGALKSLHNEKLPGKRAMVCTTGETFLKDLGYVSSLNEELEQAGVSYIYYENIRPNPTVEMIMEGGAFGRENQVDMVISLGGGGCHDAAKAIAVAVPNTRHLWDYIQDGSGKGMPFDKKPLPVICVTTTAGTGSETNAGAVINNLDTNEKLSLKGAELFPALCVVDPTLMCSVPPKGTAMQGFDALTHCMEVYVSKCADYASEMYALCGMEHAAKYLARAVADGKDIEAREHMAFASYLGGRCLAHGAIGMHALEHAMSGYYPALPHGLGLAMIAKAYYRMSVHKHVADERYIKMAKVMGKEDATRPEDFLAVLEGLMDKIGLGEVKMSDFGITREDFPRFIHLARSVQARLMMLDLCPFTDEEIMEIFETSYA